MLRRAAVLKRICDRRRAQNADMEEKILSIENKSFFCIFFLNAGNKKTVCLDENHFNQNKLFFIFTLIIFYENN